jgi:ABC-type transport system involved in multi-copper enzyme maturation permease subunit
MFAKFFIKEWRDNRLLLSLMGLGLAALIIVGLAGQDDTAIGIAGVLLLLVLPISALFLGSGAYSSELKENAWTYLFSKPIRKSTIWIYKYLTLLSFLAATLLVLTLAVKLLPGLKSVRTEFFALSFFSNLAIYGLATFLAFSIAYSLSILSEKPLVIFMVSILLSILLIWLHVQSLQFFRARYAYWDNFWTWGLFVAASFILASILTLTRVDFSQQVRKLMSFIGFVLLFLALSFVAETLIVSKGNPFSKPWINSWYSFRAQDNVYFGTRASTVVFYDSKTDIIRKSPIQASFYESEFSTGGGKIGYFMVSKSWIGTRRAEAFVVNLDGSQKTSLARFYGSDSPFNGWTPQSNILISPGGKQVGFVAAPPGRGWRNNPPHIFWMNTDGTGRTDKTLDFFRKGTIVLLSWLEDERSIVLRLAEKDIHSLTIKIIKINIETGATKSLETTLPYPNNFEWMPAATLSPDRRSVIIKLWDEAQKKDQTALLDLGLFETKVIGENIPFWGATWAPQGDRLAYTNYRPEHNLMVYSLADGALKKVWKQSEKRIGFSYDWLADGRLIVAGGGKAEWGTLTILSKDYAVEKRIKIPDRILKKLSIYRIGVIGLDDKALIPAETGGVWRLDLKTEDWKKVY